jgi:hypothetical protein
MIQSLVSLIQGLDDAGQSANINDDIGREPNTPFADGVPKHGLPQCPGASRSITTQVKALGVASRQTTS